MSTTSDFSSDSSLGSLSGSSIFDWKSQGYRYYPLAPAMRRRFGCPVWKISVDAGFSCPNVDGTVGRGGCIFCNTHSFAPSRALLAGEAISRQIDEGVKRLRRRHRPASKFIAYFQPSTNTYATPETLETMYREAMRHPEIIGLAVGTRPDALPDEVLELLQRLAKETDIQLEIGLQSIYQKSLDFLRRGHDYPVFSDAFRRSSNRGLHLGVHLILGLPGESREDIRETAREIARLRPDYVKLHHLYVVRDTAIAEMYEKGLVRLPTLQEYAETVVDFLEWLPPEIIIERISSETTGDFLLGPAWTDVKHAARNAVEQEFRRRNTFQGMNCGKGDRGL